MLQSGLNISGLEQQLMAQGLDAETARAAAAYASGQMQLSPYANAAQIAQEQRGQNAGFFGSVIGGAMSGGFSGGGGSPQLNYGSSFTSALDNPNYWKSTMPGGGYSY
jgi:hypothetical protein